MCLKLKEYDYKIIFKPDKINKNADNIYRVKDNLNVSFQSKAKLTPLTVLPTNLNNSDDPNKGNKCLNKNCKNANLETIT